MNKKEYLLTCISEECAEVSQRATKIMRFGASNIREGQPFDNLTLLQQEITDLAAVIEMYQSLMSCTLLPIDRGEASAKKLKVTKYMALAEKEGRVTSNAKI